MLMNSKAAASAVRLLNEAFCVELTPFIQESGADAWIYGHSHRNRKEFKIGATEMLTNQLGYVEMGEHPHRRSDYLPQQCLY